MPRERKRRSCLFWIFFLPLLVGLLVVGGCNLWVVLSTADRVYESVDTVPEMEVGIVLGTTKKIGPDQPNPHFENRLAAAAALYKAGKVRRFLVSGYRDSQYYDEPRDMTTKLVELGVPPEVITPDDAGLRTLDSIVRAREVYGMERVVVISDDFHVSRALFIADRKGIDAIAFRGKSVGFRDSFPARIREYFARIKAVIDLYLLDTQPANLDPSREGLAWRG